MRTLNVIILILLALVGPRASASTGQETWGGDAVALRFVEIGRILGEEMSANPRCPLRTHVPLDRFRASVESTLVESSNDDRPSVRSHVYLNRLKWYGLPEWRKVAAVFAAYAAFDLPKAVAPSRAEVELCRSLPYWSRIGSKPDEHVDVGDDVASQILAASRELAHALRSVRDPGLLSSFDLRGMQELLRDGVPVETVPGSISFPGKLLKDGRNSHGPDGRSLTIGKAFWRSLTRSQRRELLFHEYLGLLGANDRRYQISSRLLFALDEKFF